MSFRMACVCTQEKCGQRSPAAGSPLQQPWSNVHLIVTRAAIVAQSFSRPFCSVSGYRLSRCEGPTAFHAIRTVRHAQSAALVGLSDHLIRTAAGVEGPPLDAILSIRCELGDVAVVTVWADESKALD